MIFKQREIKKRSYRGRFLFSFIARGYRMKYYMLLLLLMSLFVNSYAQEEGEDMPPIPPMPGQQAQKKTSGYSERSPEKKWKRSARVYPKAL